MSLFLYTRGPKGTTMKRVDILSVDSKTSKLTIATDRITVKLSNDLNDEERKVVELFLLSVAEDIPTDVGFTIRGQYENKTDHGGKLHRGVRMMSSDVKKSWAQWFPHVL